MKQLGLYVHIPFCKKKCDYCDFLSCVKDDATKTAYMKVLKREIEAKASLYQNDEVDTIFIGGGTPTAVDVLQLIDVLNCIKSQYRVTDDCEISMECNPGTVSREGLKTYRAAGINRISIGLQSTEDGLLKELGRIHTYDQFLNTYRWAKEAGFSNMNADIMSALPNQTVESYRSTLQKVLELDIQHISAYSLIIEEGTPFYSRYEKNELCLPSEEDERQMYYDTKTLLEQAGFYRYEISNYAKKGYECEHNKKYWTRKNYVGFGLGASSCYENVRYQNSDDFERYITEQTYMIKTNVEVLSEKDCMEEFMFLGLRQTKGISKAEFESCFGQTIEKVYGTVLNKLKENKLIEESGDTIALTDYGLDVSNSVFCEFLL